MATLAARIDLSTPPVEAPHGLALTYQRLMLVMLLFVGATVLVVARLGMLQIFTDRTTGAQAVDPLLPPRGDIVDRNGLPLARTIDAWSIGVHPSAIIGDRRALAAQLAGLMPEHDAAQYYAMLSARRSYVYLARRALPELVQSVNALGEPGIVFNREPERLYPQTAMAGHVLGWTDSQGHGVTGMERVLDAQLSDPARRGTPAMLSIDSRVQSIVESELANQVSLMSADGGTGIVMDVQTGEVLALASAPTFNPNAFGHSDPNALLNRATMSVYELGSVFKPITIAAALDAHVVTSLHQQWDVSPLFVGGSEIHDDQEHAPTLDIMHIITFSSNRGAARIADAMGGARMEAALRSLGFDRRPQLELRERTLPLFPREYSQSTLMRLGFGHAIAITPLHLATAYCALVNGGIYHPATLLHRAPGAPVPGHRVFSEQSSFAIRQLLRLNVLHGTGRIADVPGFRVGGKTGTGEKPGAGGYDRHANVTSFAAAFPIEAPRYVVLIMMDAPRPNAANSGVTTAAMTSAPVAGRIIQRIGALLGVIPETGRDIDTTGLWPADSVRADH
jgi:cell division protein FtsI (penicillin-binding protein 3)